MSFLHHARWNHCNSPADTAGTKLIPAHCHCRTHKTNWDPKTAHQTNLVTQKASLSTVVIELIIIKKVIISTFLTSHVFLLCLSVCPQYSHFSSQVIILPVLQPLCFFMLATVGKAFFAHSLKTVSPTAWTNSVNWCVLFDRERFFIGNCGWLC